MFTGGLNAVDNAAEGRTEVSIDGGSAVNSVSVVEPLFDTGTATDPVIGIREASEEGPGSMSRDHYLKLDSTTEDATADSIPQRGADGAIRNVKTGVGTSVLIGAELKNTTAAAGGANQYSPALVLTGNGYTGAASHAGNWALQSRPVGASSSLGFFSQINAGGYTLRFTIDSAGGIAITGDLAHSAAGKVGFYGISAIARPSAYTQTYSTADKTMSAWTPDPESSTYSGLAGGVGGSPYASIDDLNVLRAAYQNLLVHTEDLTQFVNSILDDLQALGLLQ